MPTPLRRASSRLFGWMSDLRLPRALRAPVYRAYGRHFGVDLSELRLPLEEHPSFGAFFVRRLREGARPFPPDPSVLPSPADGYLQSLDSIRDGSVLQAKGRPYAVRELLAGAGEDLELEGGHAWTIYLSPRDYHRVHSPEDSALAEVRWVRGARYSVDPRVLARRPRVLSINERAVLRLEGANGTLLLVMVGALNVGRIRVVGVEPWRSGSPNPPRALRRGEELARFEMGSTVVLIAPRGRAVPVEGLEPGSHLRMGQVIGRR
ncbi:MAG TPA: archaetidylserine decarboxylase [Planctomycetota bacterium]|nr:archaetidylserine decarboxylase [Planctomycetota bacterium]